jgi:alkanesulfonate monooxygenase SsuD/methylene tetrahydromethanopterin reductase-like flavin-dependent oxidoreductase (luciferase family)
MKFGVFDHMDDNGVTPARQFEERLGLIEAYDRAGFYAFHLAEHHCTPLGLAPSPGIMMAAIAQRTKRLRFGPLVYILPLYHPLRLIEEICMLDQMSGGRFELGVGRGVSPIEVGFFGVDPAEGPRRFAEALAVVRRGLTEDTLSFAGEFYRFENVPMITKPVQRPHPPLWYGIGRIETVPAAAANGANIVASAPVAYVRAITDRYRAEWRALGRAAEQLPLLGLSRHIVLAEREDVAIATAQRAYRRWRQHMEVLWLQHGMTLPLALPHEFDPSRDGDRVFAGTAAAARRFIAEQVEAAGATYFVCDIAFGDMPAEEAHRTVALMAREVLPAFA